MQETYDDEWPQELAEDGIQDEGSVSCPYCGETLTLMIDYSAGDQAYVEDCHVCCHPILIEVRHAEYLSVTARRENE